MTPAELVWRAGSGLRARLIDRWGGAGPEISFDNHAWKETLVSLAEPEASAVLEAADRIARGELSFWGRRAEVDVQRPDWHADPLTGQSWEESAWRGSGRDPKPVWELNHLHHLVPLAAGAALSEHPEWARVVIVQSLDWVDRNPRPAGIGWASGYEAAHRLIAWALSLPLVVEHASDDELSRLEAAFGEHQAFVAARPSRYSSANNHRLVELVGLLAASVLTPGSPDWDSLWAELVHEAERQTYADGGSREQAGGYFLYALEILWLATELARGAGRDPKGLDDRLGVMLGWLAAVGGGDGEPPLIGDDAEDRVFRLDYFEPRRAVAIRARIVRRGVTTPPPALGSVLLPESGYAVLRSERARIVFDVGELGFGSLAAHGHADALSVLVDVGGESVLRDTGTGSYVVGRDEDRATAFHNTVVIDGESQARVLGPHLWGRRFEVRIEATSLAGEQDYVRASHDGYRPSRHTRSVTRLGDRLLVVLDRVTGEEPVTADLVWQPGEGFRPDGLAVVSDPPSAQDELLGRFSPRYTWTESRPRLVWSATGSEVVFASAISLGHSSLPELRLERHGDGVIVEIAGLRVSEDWASDSIDATNVSEGLAIGNRRLPGRAARRRGGVLSPCSRVQTPTVRTLTRPCLGNWTRKRAPRQRRPFRETLLARRAG